MTNSLITSDGMRTVIRQLANTAKLKADQADKAFLLHADPRAVQGGAICEIASGWRDLARSLHIAAVHAAKIID